MKKLLTLILGFMIAGLAAWAVPREVKKDFPGIEKSIKLKIEIVKVNVVAIATIVEQGESPGQPTQNIYSINKIDQFAEENIALPIDYPYSWQTQNYSTKQIQIAEIKLTANKTLRQLKFRC